MSLDLSDENRNVPSGLRSHGNWADPVRGGVNYAGTSRAFKAMQVLRNGKTNPRLSSEPVDIFRPTPAIRAEIGAAMSTTISHPLFATTYHLIPILPRLRPTRKLLI